MGKYLIDNNVISGYFSNSFGKNGLEFVGNIIDQTPNISVVTEIEALSWVSSEKNKEKFIEDFVHDANDYALTAEIVKKCIEIRRERKIKTPDAIIAATAIVYSLTLLTGDSDFNGIKKLSLINPFKL